MSDPTPIDPHAAHDDCADCRREKKENEALIGIYERLQKVEKRKEEMREAVRQHRLGGETNRSFYRIVEEKLRSLPKMKEKDDEYAVEKIGIEIAAAVMERQSRSTVYQENQRLKLVLKRMHRDKLSESLNVSQVFQQTKTDPANDLQSVRNKKDRMDQTYTNTTSSHRKLHSMDTLQKLILSQDNTSENSTQSSSFKTTARPPIDLSRYNDMNLWLYQHQPHSQLEQQLFLPTTQTARPRQLLPTSHATSFPLASALPQLRRKK